MSNVVTSHPTPAQPKKTWSQRAGAEVKDLADSTGKVKIPDFLFGFAMVFLSVQLPGGLPLGTVAVVFYTIYTFMRKAEFENPRANVFVMLMMLCVGFTALTSITLGQSETADVIRRVVRLLIVIAFVGVIADRRVDFKSMILGTASALVANVPVFYAGLSSNTYGGYLTGWIPDKNVSGLWYAIIGLLLVVSLDKRHHKILAVLLFGVFIYLTGSRTSTAAFIFGLIWLFVAARLNLIAKICLGAFVVWAVEYLTANFANTAAFGDRTGTDALRERIDAASLEKLHNTPWSGLGYGQATVNVQDLTFFFHNSFWSLIVEGGYIYMIAVVALMIVAVYAWKQPGELRGKKRIVIGEAALVLLFICSWRLGEVLLTTPWAMAVGLALAQLAVFRNRREIEYLSRTS